MIEFKVIGTPAAQGSKRPFRNKFSGKISMVEMSKKLSPWREAVKFAARQVITTTPAIPGPVSVAIVFTMPKPKSAPKRTRTFPDRTPDIDKCLRSTFDALVQAGVIEDDARVVRCAAMKVYPNEWPGALDVPGALIRVSAFAPE